MGLQVRATIANHRIRHRGNRKLFFEGPLESACKPHHDSLIQREEKRGYRIGCDASGRPLAADHPWNRS